MPKEVIYDVASMFDTVLTWESDHGKVQLGIKMSPPTHDGAATNLYELVQSWVQPQPIVSVSGGVQVSGTFSHGSETFNSASFVPGTPAEEVGDSLWCTLDRDAINRLVRALRRARDQAFGADA